MSSINKLLDNIENKIDKIRNIIDINKLQIENQNIENKNIENQNIDIIQNIQYNKQYNEQYKVTEELFSYIYINAKKVNNIIYNKNRNYIKISRYNILLLLSYHFILYIINIKSIFSDINDIQPTIKYFNYYFINNNKLYNQFIELNIKNVNHYIKSNNIISHNKKDLKNIIITTNTINNENIIHLNNKLYNEKFSYYPECLIILFFYKENDIINNELMIKGTSNFEYNNITYPTNTIIGVNLFQLGNNNIIQYDSKNILYNINSYISAFALYKKPIISEIYYDGYDTDLIIIIQWIASSIVGISLKFDIIGDKFKKIKQKYNIQSLYNTCIKVVNDNYISNTLLDRLLNEKI